MKLTAPLNRPAKIIVVLSAAAAVFFFLALIPQVRNAGFVLLQKYLPSNIGSGEYLDNIIRFGVSGILGCIVLILYFLGTAKIIINAFLAACVRHTFLRVLVLAIPIVYGFMIVAVFGVNIVYADDWAVPYFIDNVLKNGLTFDMLFAQHNEHRQFFPRFVFLAIGLLTHLNNKVNMFFSWLLQTGMYVAMLAYIKHIIPEQTERGSKRRLTLGLLIGFCCFNLVQQDNTLWGFQIAFMMVACFAVLSFYYFSAAMLFAQKKSAMAFIFLSVVFGIIASFSSLQGLFVFPSIIVALILTFFSFPKSGFAQTKARVVFVVFFVFMLASMIAYLHNLSSNFSAEKLSTGVGVFDILQMFVFFFTAIGSPLSCHIIGVLETGIFFFVGLAVFIISIMLCVYLIKHKKILEHIFPVSLIIFGYAFCLSITLGRGDGGIGSALVARYTTFSLFIIIGLILILYTEFIANNNAPRHKQAATTILLLFAFLIFLQNTDILNVKYIRDERKEMQHITRTYKDRTLKELGKVMSNDDLDEGARNSFRFLEERQWGVFAP